MPLTPLAPLATASLFPALHTELMALLHRLEPADWERSTVAGAWRVHDIAAHLLDGDLRKLAVHRDGHVVAPDAPLHSYADVVALIQRLNAGGVAFGRRLSPRLLIDLLEMSGRWVSDFIATLDPDASALYSVAWAGEDASDNRFDTAREYTERWHHQMQMRVAIDEVRGQPGRLLSPPLFEPLLATAVRALPHAYREQAADDGSTVTLQVTGPVSAAWTLQREPMYWRLHAGAHDRPSLRVSAEADVWWRLFFNALNEDSARASLLIEGDAQLLAPLLRTRSVMV